MSIIQYIKDTRGELRHVAWPMRTQTIVYTTLVIAISIGTALYLGLFDYIFTTGLARFIEVLPPSITETSTIPAPQIEITPVTSGSGIEITPIPLDQVPPVPTK